ncbi:MAG: translation initiation factor IF-2 [Deltaproteobacteria bacterium]|nr:translation initiation factor IF-2 [Deltaproteobacteria bacterium]
MAKKRVHELAKEFGLDNREVVRLLQAAGIDAKTHSSSVYEEEARAVLSKTSHKVEETPAPPPPQKRAGMMIVRKKKAGEEPAAAAPESDDAGHAAAISAAGAAQIEVTEADSVGAHEGEEAQQSSADTLEPGMTETAADLDAEPVVVDEVVAQPEASLEAEAEQPPVARTTAPAGSESAAPAAVEAAGDSRPRPKGATVVRMIDREKLLERVPQRRLGGAAAAPGQGQRFGRVTELKVVTDPFGRGREMIDVGRDKKGRPGVAAPKGERKERAPTKREMLEMRERAVHPSRLKRKKTTKGPIKKTEVTQPKASKRVIKMRETISVQELARELGVKAGEVLKQLVGLGVMTGMNGSVDFETAQLVAQAHEYTVDSVAFAEGDHIEDIKVEEKPEELLPRPPVVTVMGHVDHGKTSLLDAIRKAKVAAGEAGGITQHIGAYQVAVKGKGSVTFLDTPGHAAFTQMRARGAKVTDIVVLVVAADDGVMPQTEEAIRHAQAAEVPIVVAINKADKPDASPERVMQALTKFELVSEAWGGQTLMIPTSATKGTGIQELLDALLLQAEMLELKANPKRPANGVVVEARLDKGRGPVATVLVKNGTLHQSDAIVVGDAYGKVRAMTNDEGRPTKEAGPSAAVEVTGLDQVPEAGDVLNVVESADAAREVAEHRRAQKRTTEMVSGPKMSLEDLMAKMKGGEVLELNIVLKADVKGSVEAIRDAANKLSTDEVKVNVRYGGVGAITESDIMLASASKGIVIGFNVRPDANARDIAAREGVEIRMYKIIYEVLDDVRKAMEGLLAPESKEKLVGHAEVREIFKIAKIGTIAGCRVTDGKALRSARVRILRDSVPVFEGKVASLKHFKNDAREVEAGLECGVSIEGFNDIKPADVIEFFQVEEIARTLDAPPPSGKRPGGGAEARP